MECNEDSYTIYVLAENINNSNSEKTQHKISKLCFRFYLQIICILFILMLIIFYFLFFKNI